MYHVRMFKPVRHVSEEVPDPGASLDTRVAVQPVTNTPPPGPLATAAEEEGWLALLELVFAQTGWPDADEDGGPTPA